MYFISLLLARKIPDTFLTSPLSLLSHYRHGSHSLLPYPWHAPVCAARLMQNLPNCISTSKLWNICLCTLKSICSIWILCIPSDIHFCSLELINIVYTYASLACICCFKFLFLFFLCYNLIAIYITVQVSCSNLVIKMQYKLYLTVCWYLCQM